MSARRRGTIRLVAGTGLSGEGGDGGPATEAEFSAPSALCVDAGGNLFVADHASFSVRRVDAATGIISTVAGGLQDLPAGLPGCGEIDVSQQALPDGAPALCAALEASCLAASGDRLVLALPDENRVRYVDLRTGLLHTLIGTGQPGFAGDGASALAARLDEPFGIAFDSDGSLYVADTQNDRVRRVAAADGTITTVAGGGRAAMPSRGQRAHALDARLTHPRHLVIEPAGTLVVSCDQGVFRLFPDEGLLAGLAADSGPCDELTMGLDGLACDPSGTLYFSCPLRSAVMRLTPGGAELEQAVGSGCIGDTCLEQGDADSVDLISPKGLATTADGGLYFVDAALLQAFLVQFE